MDNKTVIISFSARKNGNCEQIAEYIRAVTQIRTNVVIYKFSEYRITPCGYCEYECFKNGADCPRIGDKEFELLEAVSSSDMVYFIVPNYCDHPCSNFYLFNERSLCYFQGQPERLEKYLSVPKKFVVISGSQAESFRTAFVQHVDNEPQILYLSANNYGKRSIQGDLVDVTAARADLERFLTDNV